jgi:hypothetical protein
VALDDQQLTDRATRLVDVPGVLGGSRARDDHLPESGVDLGLYYRHSIDVTAPGELARTVGGPTAEVTALDTASALVQDTADSCRS